MASPSHVCRTETKPRLAAGSVESEKDGLHFRSDRWKLRSSRPRLVFEHRNNHQTGLILSDLDERTKSPMFYRHAAHELAWPQISHG